MELLDFALSLEDPLKPYGEVETLLYYSLVSKPLSKFTGKREIASKNWIPNASLPYLLRRGSYNPPLTSLQVHENVDKKFLKMRRELRHLREAKGKISKIQEVIWNYFLPRKLADYFYACNHESPGRQIQRIFIDVDRGKGITSEEARIAASCFLNELDDAETFQSISNDFRKERFSSWTGSSFHIYLFLKKPMHPSFYLDNFQARKNKMDVITEVSSLVSKSTNLKIASGHEKIQGRINFDPSGTPSGKLARMPLGSLHMKDAKTVDGVSIPLKSGRLYEPGLINELREYNPRKVLEDLKELQKSIPSLS